MQPELTIFLGVIYVGGVAFMLYELFDVAKKESRHIDPFMVIGLTIVSMFWWLALPMAVVEIWLKQKKKRRYP